MRNDRAESDGKTSDESNKPRRSTDGEKAPEPSKSYLVEWDGENDPLDPRTLSAARKWFNVAVVAMGSLLVSVLSFSCLNRAAR